MQTHPDDLDLYVMDAVSDERREEIEAHVMACAECAAALQREARLELALPEVAQASIERERAPIPIARASRRRPRRICITAGLAAAAGLAALLGTRVLMRHSAAPTPIVVNCPIDEHARACVDQARMHGLYVQYPIPRPVPIYESPNLAGGVIAGN